MNDFNPGDKVRMIGDDTFTGTVTETRRCTEGTPVDPCPHRMVTFVTEHDTTHTTHASDLEPA